MFGTIRMEQHTIEIGTKGSSLSGGSSIIIASIFEPERLFERSTVIKSLKYEDCGEKIVSSSDRLSIVFILDIFLSIHCMHLRKKRRLHVLRSLSE